MVTHGGRDGGILLLPWRGTVGKFVTAVVGDGGVLGSVVWDGMEVRYCPGWGRVKILPNPTSKSKSTRGASRPARAESRPGLILILRWGLA